MIVLDQLLFNQSLDNKFMKCLFRDIYFNLFNAKRKENTHQGFSKQESGRDYSQILSRSTLAS